MYACFNPKTIVNKYTGQEVTVDCRKCYYCRNKRSIELQARVDREFLNPENTYALFVSLKYDNDHLPIYTLSERQVTRQYRGKTYTRRQKVWKSNRCQKKSILSSEVMEERYPELKFNEVDYFYKPNNHKNRNFCFGHLCYPDILEFITKLRASIHTDFKRKYDIINTLDSNDSYETFKFRYFLVGEYGPTTLRPHYHAILWFSSKPTEARRAYISKKLSESWKNGNYDVRPITSSGVSGYLASYVNSFAKLPQILRTRNLKPFAIFSKGKTIGSYKITDDEILQILTTGASERTKYSKKLQIHVLEALSPYFYTRFFPKCTGFNYEDYRHKLYIYNYVAKFFATNGITHEVSEVDSIRLSQIKWPESPRYEFNYTDKYASLTAYRYMVKFGWTCEMIIDAFTRIYTNIKMSNLKRMYEEQEETFSKYDLAKLGSVTNNTLISAIMITMYSKPDGDYYINFETGRMINIDPYFLDRLPAFWAHLEEYQLNALESYGIDVDYLYPCEFLEFSRLEEFKWRNDPKFLKHVEEQELLLESKVKTKKMNDYKEYLENSGKIYSNTYRVSFNKVEHF